MVRSPLATARADSTGTTTDGASTGPVDEVSTEAVESFEGAVDTAVDAVGGLTTGFIAGVPAFLVGLVVFVVFYLLARVARRMLGPRLTSLRGESLGQVITSLVYAGIITVGVLVFLAIVFPAVNVATLLGAGGVVALAAGFAFQDLLENLMAGILLLLRQPFQIGDVIEVDGAEGVVEAVTVRETRIRRFDREVVVVPNAQVYKNAIVIQTEFDEIMSSVVVGVGYGDDLQLAEDVAVAAMAGVDGVVEDPAPEAFYIEFGDSSINLDLRYFHRSGQHELRRVQGEVVKAVKAAFDEHEIEIPFPIRTLDAADDVAAAMRAVADRRTGRSNGHVTPVREEA